jgi:hypothetical protein
MWSLNDREMGLSNQIVFGRTPSLMNERTNAFLLKCSDIKKKSKKKLSSSESGISQF